MVGSSIGPWGRDCPLRADRGPRSSQGSKTARRRRGRRALVLDSEETAIQWEIPGNPAPTSSVFLFAAAASPSDAREKQGGPAGCQPSLRESEGLQKPQLRHAHHVTTGDQAVIENADLDERQRLLQPPCDELVG